jgi:hypothetical protein
LRAISSILNLEFVPNGFFIKTVSIFKTIDLIPDDYVGVDKTAFNVCNSRLLNVK